MLNLNTNIYKISMPTYSDYRILTRNDKVVGKPRVIMTEINEEEEKEIDNIGNHYITLHRGNKSFTVKAVNIYCYGEINLNKEEDIEQLKTLTFLNNLEFSGIHIPADYNYETHECISPIKRFRYTETWNPLKVIKYNHGCLNKPKRIIIFKTV